jgi:plastocyanin
MMKKIVLLSLALFAVSCGKNYNSSPTSPSNQIPAGSTTVLVPAGASGNTNGPGFVPTPLTVAAGTTVTWGNNDNTTHTTTSDKPGWDMTLGAGGTATVKFDTPGTYTYHCSIHSFMKGTIIVQ